MSLPVYFDQVDLLLSILNDSLEDPRLALKGGAEKFITTLLSSQKGLEDLFLIFKKIADRI